MNNYSGIYKIENAIDGKVYIGSASNISDRWACHLSTLKSNNHSNRHLQNAWNKYGENDFIFVILEIVDDKLLAKREQYFIDAYKSANREYGYNIIPTARIFTHTIETKEKIAEANRRRIVKPETREKMSEYAKNRPKEHAEKINEYLKNKTSEHLTKMGLSHRGKKLSAEHKERLISSNRGKKFSPEHCAKISAATKGEKNPMFGKIISEETRQKMSLASKGKKKSPEHIANMRKAQQRRKELRIGME